MWCGDLCVWEIINEASKNIEMKWIVELKCVRMRHNPAICHIDSSFGDHCSSSMHSIFPTKEQTTSFDWNVFLSGVRTCMEVLNYLALTRSMRVATFFPVQKIKERKTNNLPISNTKANCRRRRRRKQNSISNQTLFTSNRIVNQMSILFIHYWNLMVIWNVQNVYKVD